MDVGGALRSPNGHQVLSPACARLRPHLPATGPTAALVTRRNGTCTVSSYLRRAGINALRIEHRGVYAVSPTPVILVT
jgi:hypothetical protein